MTDGELDDLSQEEIESLMKRSNELNQKAFDYIKRVKDVENGLVKRIDELKEENVLEVLDNYISPLIEEYGQNEKIKDYLMGMKADIVANYHKFMGDEGKGLWNPCFPLEKRRKIL